MESRLFLSAAFSVTQPGISVERDTPALTVQNPIAALMRNLKSPGSLSPASSPASGPSLPDSPEEDDLEKIFPPEDPNGEEDLNERLDFSIATPPDGTGTLADLTVTSGTWALSGPSPITVGSASYTGRITAVAAHPTDPNTIYVGAASGGVWKSTDGGVTWVPKTETQATLVTGAIAIAPSNPNIIYVGTGEANYSADAAYGRGILKSIDSGNTWTLLGTSSFDRRTISKIVVDPANANIVYATVGGPGVNGFSGNCGVWKSTDGGTSWTNTTAGSPGQTNLYYTDLVMDPSNSQVLYTAIGYLFGSTANGVYKTTNGGATWSLAGNFPTGDSTNGRIALAIAPSSPSTLYCAITSSSTYALYKMLKSTDSGATWSAVSGTVPNYLGGQGWYDTTLLVNPTNANMVYAAGAAGTNAILRTSDGGATWSSIQTGVSGSQDPHPDHHGAAFDANGRYLDGNDGGLWRLNNATAGSISWGCLNGNLNTTQFIGVGVHPTNNVSAYGGSQDNGTSQYSNSSTWTLREGGDGGDVLVSANLPSRVYHIAPVGSFGTSAYIRRSDNSGVSWASRVSGIVEPSSTNFYPPISIDDAHSTASADRVFTGTNRVYESTNNADTWVPLSTTNTAGWDTTNNVNLIAAAPSDINTIYASAGGRTYVTTNRGTSWTRRDVAGGNIMVSDIVVDPLNSLIAYATLNRFGGGKIYRTIDGGANWTDITGNLVDLPVYAAQLEPRTSSSSDDVLYIGDDNGVYALSNPQGSTFTWSRMGSGLPNVQVRDLELNQNNMLYAGTYGRGMWQILTLPPTVTGIAGTVFNDNNGNGVKDTGELGISGKTVYLDTNASGTFDSFASTNSALPIQAIPDNNPSGLSSNVSISGLTQPISDVNVTINLTHTFDSDLIISLTSPAGQTVVLANAVGGAGDNFTSTVFDDASPTGIAAGTAPFTGTFKPSSPLSAFNGFVGNGTWTMNVVDVATGSTGTFNSWTLTVIGGDFSATTDQNGLYFFNTLVGGTAYSVGVVPIAGMIQTFPVSLSLFHSVTPTTGSVTLGKDFGFFRTSYSIAGDYVVRLDASATKTEILIGGVVQYSATSSLIPSLTFTPGAGTDSITVDLVNGNPIPASGISFDGGIGTDAVVVSGSLGIDSIGLTSTAATVGGRSLTFSNAESVTINGQNGDDTVTMSSPAPTIPLVVNGGVGNDTFTISVAPAAAVTFNGGLTATDQDTLNVNAGTYTIVSDPSLTTANLAVVNNAILNLAGINSAISSLSGSGVVTSSVAGAVTLSVAVGGTFAGVIQNGSGTVSLNKTAAGVFNLTGTNTYTGGTSVSGGILDASGGSILSSVGPMIVTNASSRLIARQVAPSSLSVGIGASLKLTNVDTTVNFTGRSTAGSLSNSGLIDVGSTGLIVGPAGGSGGGLTESLIVSQIQSARGSGNWAGTAGLTSSTAAADPTHRAVGFTLVNGQWTIAQTVIGDSNLDGGTNVDDLSKLAQNYNLSGKSWQTGDFNYDGTVNIDDLSLLAQNYNTTIGSSDSPAADAPSLALSRSIIASVAGQPKLQTSLTRLPSGIKAGASWTVTTRVKNQGSDAGKSVIRFYLSKDKVLSPGTDVFVGKETYLAIKAGQTIRRVTTLTEPRNLAPGKYFLIARTDTGDSEPRSIQVT